MNQLTANKIEKSYGSKQVVNQVSLTINGAEVVGLLGPNGAGKTTTFYTIVGLVKADKGNIVLDGENITHLTIDKRAHKGLAYLPQEASIFRKLTVQDNVLSILELRKDLNANQRYDQLNKLLNDFNLSHLADTVSMRLSGGERRRLEIARALAIEPKFILLDEPFAGVDPISVSEIKSLITGLARRGIGVLITDHNVRETLDICDRAYIISQGKVIAEGSADVVASDPLVKSIYLGDNFSL